MHAALPGIELGSLLRKGAFDILHSLNDGAYITTPEREIVFWNQAAERLTGWSSQEVLGKKCSDNILVHVDKDGHALCGAEYCPLHRAMVTGERSERPLVIFARKRQGGRIAVEVTVSPLFDEAGRVIGGMEIFRDLTSNMDDLKRAKAIQDHILESPLPKDSRVTIASCYTPQEMIGGDFYHIERIDADHYGLLVADIMGHGVSAALYCMQLRSAWEEFRADLLDPPRFMGAVARRLYEQVAHDGYYATAVYILFDAASGKIRAVIAGHPAPLIVGRDAGVRKLGGRNPALGLFPDSVFEESVEQLDPADTLLIYTDGAIEVAGSTGEELGEAGMIEMLRTQLSEKGRISLTRLEEQLLRWSSHVRMPDDLTLVSLAYSGKS